MNILEEIRDLMEKNDYPLNYNPEEWRNFPNANCYPYALGIKIDEGYLIGDFIGHRVTDSDSIEKQKMVFKIEMEALGFEVFECETEDIADEGCFKIYIEWNSRGEYHFLREDEDGTWSHKAAGYLPKRTDQTGMQIYDPDAMMNQMGNFGQCYLISIF